MLQESYPYFLANTAVSTNQHLAVHDKYTGEVVTQVALAEALYIEAGKAIRDVRYAIEDMTELRLLVIRDPH
ncbi:hypothetical protein KFJ24_03255 [Marinobacter sediminum]|uniref:hypothetical protein n=1 Tax=Marinobacter sediminum TaxID=256323 RepID=UPI002030323E|nr:hypothetical protein [Marinobacter sediminum]MCM0611492.1 hypothetical protein [Marinobacter sediminum]